MKKKTNESEVSDMLENVTVIVVDMQNDFVHQTLGTKEAKAIISAVKALAELAVNGKGNQLIFTKDTHGEDYLNTQEGKRLPVRHCIKGTDGWEIIPELKELAEKNTIIVEKPTFGSFALPQHISPGTEKVILCGVCTDICVISNALLLKAAFPEMEIAIAKDACAGVAKESHEAALIVAKSCQIMVE